MMRKLSIPSSSSSEKKQPLNSQLALTHLKKLFVEFTQSKSIAEKNEKLYSMLPLFCKVFGSKPICIDKKTFDIVAFCYHVSILMVCEIRKQASNQNTDEASYTIAKFLEVGNNEESSNGWMLLTTLNLLAGSDTSLIQVMIEASLPSTLVKCLYLFFDLPHISERESNSSEDFTIRERRMLLQKSFVQLLIRLCSHKSTAEELTAKDDLTLLFSAISSPCPSYNIMWRKSAAECLMTLSRHGLTPNIISYIHCKNCIKLCLDNMKRVSDLQHIEMVEMLVNMFCILKDSSEISSTLLDDFRLANGYQFLSDFLLRLETEKTNEAQESIRNLVLMITSLCMCGYLELKPSQASNGSLFQIPGFKLPHPSGHGTSVRNIQAFNVLQSTFLKSSSSLLSGIILDAVSSIYNSDNSNYFILENENTLSQFIEKIYHKPPEIQRKVFQLTEFLVYHLNFVPCKELISESIFLKTNGSNHLRCTLLCIQSLLNIIKHHDIFKDVYREVGLLEVFATCLKQYETYVENKHDATTDGSTCMDQEEIGKLIMECLTVLLSGNNSNANVLRVTGGTNFIHSLVKFPESRYLILGIIKELILSNGGDDDMAKLLSNLRDENCASNSIQLKIDILEALKLSLRESHKARTIFRKVNGLACVSNIISDLEDSLKEYQDNLDVFKLLHLIFQTISTGIRFEPANAKNFDEICKTTLSNNLKQLGCFKRSKTDAVSENSLSSEFVSSKCVYHNLFISCLNNPNIASDVPPSLAYATFIYRLLCEVALDLFDRVKAPAPKTPSKYNTSILDNTCGFKTADNTINLAFPEYTIIHPGAVNVMLHLLPHIKNEKQDEVLNLQLYLTELMKALLRSEKNQQIMCTKGFINILLTVGQRPLENENHTLHEPFQYMFEHLAMQSISSADLRTYLRLGNPLCCLPISSEEPRGNLVSLTRIKSLVSMTTPKDFRSQAHYMLPPYVEFDMTAEGFGCLYLPNISPNSHSTGTFLGGIGSGDRLFPPQTGLTYTTWICVEKFSDPRTDPHVIRLLTLVKHIATNNDEHLVCLSVVLSARDKAIIVSTEERPISQFDYETETHPEQFARVWNPDIIQEGHWHHIVIVLNRAVLKNSTLSIYLDGQQLLTKKMQYISQNVTGVGGNFIAPTSIYGYVGTAPNSRQYSRLCWRQGPCHLFEEVFTPHSVSYVYQLGPQYLGSFLSTTADSKQIVTEEKIIFGLNAKASSSLTLNKIRKVYSRIDSKSIAKQLGIPSHDSATPLKILHNSAGHLSGAARTLGGVVIGYLGVRVFSPRPIAVVLDSLGGCTILLGLIAMAPDVETLYASVKALVCVVRSSKIAQAEMDRKRYYQTLAMLLRRKKSLLNSHILHLAFSLVGTVDTRRESSIIPSKNSFQDLLCDLEIWNEAPGELLRSLLEHFYELAAESNEKANNIWIMREVQLVRKLLHILTNVRQSSTRQILFLLLSILLGGQPRSDDFLIFGQYIAGTIPDQNVSEKSVIFNENMNEDNRTQNILIRNKCLQLLHSLICVHPNRVTEEIMKILGFDWLLLFMQSHIHASTVVIALQILIMMCSNTIYLNHFREGNYNGNWLYNVEQTKQNDVKVVLKHHLSNSHENIPTDNVNIPGFQYLAWLLPNHLEIPEIYLLLSALMMGQSVKLFPTDTKFDLDTIWMFLWGKPLIHQPVRNIQSKINLSIESVVILLSLAREIQHSDPYKIPDWLKSHTLSIIQVLFQLYHSLPELMSAFMLPEVISALAGILFPTSTMDSHENSIESTPDIDEPRQIVITETYTTKENSIILNPASQFVIDFFRVIVVDSFKLPTNLKTPPVIDIVLDAYPENSTYIQQNLYQTEVLNTIMDYLLTSEMDSKDKNVQNIIHNLNYFTGKVVDKMWQGCLLKDPHEVFDFILKLISQAKQRNENVALDSLYNSLNRCILFLLSRPTPAVADQMAILETLHKIMTNRLIIFGAGNHEPEFIGSLTYCILQLTSDMRIMLETNVRTTWHVNPSSELESRDDHLSTYQGSNLMAGAAIRVWEELYVCKKPAIEEVFKVSLHVSTNTAKAPDLTVIREQLFEAALKIWLEYIDVEKKITHKIPWELQTQIQSKIQRVAGGLTRLASRTKVKKTESSGFNNKISFNKRDTLSSMLNNLNVIREFIKLQEQQHMNTINHMQRHVYLEWLQIESDLTRERGLWGPTHNSQLDKWMLDVTEGPHRMRKKLIRNDSFYLHYPYIQEQEKGLSKHKVATSFCSKEFYHLMKKHKMTSFDSEKMYTNLSEKSSLHSVHLSSLARIKSDAEDTVEDETEDEPTASTDNQTLLRLLEDNEKITYMFRCARIQGLDSTEGLLLFGQEHCYVVDGFTLLKNREIHDIDTIPISSREYEPILPNPGSFSRTNTTKLCSKFSYEDIREVHKRRYLLQPIALEVFSGDGRNHLLAFPRKIRNKVYQKFMSLATGLNDSAQQSVAGQKCTANVEQNTGLISQFIGETSVTQRWVRGEISNFQYLMYLNTLAGRSYNDLMQYPVFPWILSDYVSEELDLTKSSTFRDLSRPMGAQSTDRLEQFKKRYKEWDDPHGETPPYHYGTHYSSAMIVCSYLVRMEPFTQHFLKLQGGHFDLADRMFHSINEAWLSASTNNMADVKELIPEFFYLPEFLKNSNNFDLGIKQNGVALGDVVLPPWAKQDYREFIRIHRMALESDFVSQNLHNWIDLIFGYKQYGQPAVDSVNVFHHLFYEGNVDIYNIEDPLKKNATIGFINNFGQIPKQLFKKPHPCKKSSMKLSGLDATILMPMSHIPQSTKLFFHSLENLKPSLVPIKEIRSPVGQILHYEKTVLAVEQNKVLIPPSFNKYVAWGFADHSLRIGNYENEKAVFITESVVSNNGEILACACPSAKTIVTGGTSSIVIIWEYDARNKTITIKHKLHGHLDAVTCLATSPTYNVIISGSRDFTVIVWDLCRGAFVRQLCGHSAPIAAVSVNDLTGDIASCSGTWLHVWDINGDKLANVNTCVGTGDSMQHILCVAFSQAQEWDTSNVIITGSTDGVTRMWSIDYVKVPISDNTSYFEEHDTSIFKEYGNSLLVKSNTMKKQIQKSLSENIIASDINILEKAHHKEQGSRHSYIQRPGFKWQRQLIFRSKLTMHTAYDRKDNTEPASVTAISISKDHRTVFIGDTRGRIFSWSVNDTVGKTADHWIKDESADFCAGCDIRFTKYERKHHCRNCGNIFCSKCTRFESTINKLSIFKPVRVCQICYTTLKTES